MISYQVVSCQDFIRDSIYRGSVLQELERDMTVIFEQDPELKWGSFF